MRVPFQFQLMALAMITAAVVVITPAPSFADTIYFSATIDAAQETPPNGSAGTGTATLIMDTVANTLTYTIDYSGLGSNENAAHIHGFSPPGVPSGILHPLPANTSTSGHKTGVWNFTEPQQANIIAGLTYINIHTTNFGGGEIRGQIINFSIPTASEWGLMIFALLLLSAGAWFVLRRGAALSA